MQVIKRFIYLCLFGFLFIIVPHWFTGLLLLGVVISGIEYLFD